MGAAGTGLLGGGGRRAKLAQLLLPRTPRQKAGAAAAVLALFALGRVLQDRLFPRPEDALCARFARARDLDPRLAVHTGCVQVLVGYVEHLEREGDRQQAAYQGDLAAQKAQHAKDVGEIERMVREIRAAHEENLALQARQHEAEKQAVMQIHKEKEGALKDVLKVTETEAKSHAERADKHSEEVQRLSIIHEQGVPKTSRLGKSREEQWKKKEYSNIQKRVPVKTHVMKVGGSTWQTGKPAGARTSITRERRGGGGRGLAEGGGAAAAAATGG